MPRTCLEIVVSNFDKRKTTLEKKVENFLAEIEQIPQFQNLTPFKSNLKDLFKIIRESGNDVAHIKEDIEAIENTLQNLEGTFKTFCFILEKTLFKKKIEQKRDEEEQKELSSKLNHSNKIESQNVVDDIPF